MKVLATIKITVTEDGMTTVECEPKELKTIAALDTLNRATRAVLDEAVKQVEEQTIIVPQKKGLVGKDGKRIQSK